MIQLTELKLIGIHGHAGVGKDTVALYLYENYQNVYGESFATPLKDACAAAFGISRDDFDDVNVKNLVNEYWGVSPRQIAQFVGTEFFRERIHELICYGEGHVIGGEDFWIRKLAGKLTGELNEQPLNPYTPGDVVIITDVRFQNEYDWIIANEGIVLHVTRPDCNGAVGIQNHASEAGIHCHTPEATYLVNNDSTLEALYAQVDAIFKDKLERKEDVFPL